MIFCLEDQGDYQDAMVKIIMAQDQGDNQDAMVKIVMAQDQGDNEDWDAKIKLNINLVYGGSGSWKEEGWEGEWGMDIILIVENQFGNLDQDQDYTQGNAQDKKKNKEWLCQFPAHQDQHGNPC